MSKEHFSRDFFVEAGRRGGRKHWRGYVPRVVRLDPLNEEQRRRVLEFVAAAKKDAYAEKAAQS